MTTKTKATCFSRSSRSFRRGRWLLLSSSTTTSATTRERVAVVVDCSFALVVVVLHSAARAALFSLPLGKLRWESSRNICYQQQTFFL